MVAFKRNRLKRVLIIILSVILTHCAVSMVATKVIYDSIFDRYDPASEVAEVPRQEHSFSCDGLQLAGYLYDSGGNRRDTLVVLAPGFHAGGDDYLPQIQSLTDKGWPVFTFDPSGSCDSEGESCRGFPQEIADLDAALRYVEENDRFGCQSIALLGHSRGGYAAGCILNYGHDIDAVISVSGVNSAMDGIMGYSTEYIGPLAYGNYGFLWAYQAMLFGAEMTDLQAHEQIENSQVPVLVVHGAADEAFPPDEYSIYAHRQEITRPGVEYLLLEEPGQNGHTDLLFDGQEGANEELMEQISAFLERSTSHE